MSYCISYGSDKDLMRFQKRNLHGLIAFSFFAAMIAGVRVFLPNLFESFVDNINPLDEYGVQAFHIMIDHVHQGIPVGQAVDVFCRSIIENAGFWH